MRAIQFVYSFTLMTYIFLLGEWKNMNMNEMEAIENIYNVPKYFFKRNFYPVRHPIS